MIYNSRHRELRVLVSKHVNTYDTLLSKIRFDLIWLRYDEEGTEGRKEVKQASTVYLNLDSTPHGRKSGQQYDILSLSLLLSKGDMKHVTKGKPVF